MNEEIEEDENVKRPIGITIAAILFGMIGVIGIIGLIVFMMTAHPDPRLLSDHFYEEIKFGTFFTFIFGCVCLIAANGLWRMKKSGGIVGIILGIITVIFGIVFYIIESDVVVDGLTVIFGVLMTILIASGWKSLT